MASLPSKVNLGVAVYIKNPFHGETDLKRLDQQNGFYYNFCRMLFPITRDMEEKMDIKIDHPNLFTEKLQNGINLFAGAGFSKLPDKDGKELPDASLLCEEICEVFSLESSYENDLERVSNVVNRRAKQQFQDFLRKKYTVTTYNSLYDALNLINIHSFITTNIDNIIQCVMDNSEKYSLYNIVEYGAAKRGKNIIPFIPLHGNVKDLASNLYFGKSELANVDNDNRELFNVMHTKLLEAPTLFIGYGFHDNAVERTISKLLEDGAKEIWILCRPGSKNIPYFRDLGCYVIEGTTEDLLSWIKNTIKGTPTAPTIVGKAFESIKQYYIPTRNEIETISSTEYFTNGLTHWYCILSGYPYETKSVNAIYEASLGNKNVIAIGIPFSGKTTIMMQLAAKMDSPLKLVIPKIALEEAQRIINVLNGTPAVVYIDDCCEDVSIANLFMKIDSIRVVGFADDYAFESSKHIFDSEYQRIEVGELEIDEAQKVYEKIPASLRHPVFKYKQNKDEKFSMLEMLNNNVQGVLTEKRINELLQRIKSTSATAFEVVALTSYLVSNKSTLNTDVLCSYYNTTDYIFLHKIIDTVSGFLKEIEVDISPDMDDQDFYSLRSHLFADLTKKVLMKSYKATFASVVHRFILNVSPYRIYRYNVFKRYAFDARFFKELFSSEAHDLYAHILRYDESIYTLQQWALYKAYLGDYAGAFADIDRAISINKYNFSVKNSRAIILFEANKNKKSKLAEDGLTEAMTILQECYYSDKRKVYHAQKYAEFALYLSENWDNHEYLPQAAEWLDTIIKAKDTTSCRSINLLSDVKKQLRVRSIKS